ncbi:MAG: copper amine oxidase N-terminal domain-containing protein [Firmicutes bacterium]|nr:copper amine oxidase N-terminal domain-containing protein [Bacillota bacterium]
MKNKVISFFVAILIFSQLMVNCAFAEDDIRVSVDNQFLSFDVAPRLIGGRTMVPLRAIFESLGAVVSWDDETKTITAYNEVSMVQTKINSNIMYVNYKEVQMDTAPMIIDGRTLIPVRFIAEAFNCDVNWDGNAKLVTIVSHPIDYNELEQPANNDKQKDDISLSSNVKYGNGTYCVGDDIPEGMYILISETKNGYFAITSDANGRSILTNDNFGGNTYVELKKNTFLELINCYAINYTDDLVFDAVDNGYVTGMFKVGKDIEAGRYKLLTVSSGYYAIYNIPYGEIVANDFFYGDNYIELKKGQYVQINDCLIKKP